MHTLKIQSRTYQLPSAWEEMTKRQITAVMPLLGYVPATETRMVALWLMLPKARRQLRRLEGSVLLEIAGRLDWIWEQREVEAMEDPAPMIPHFWYKGQRWHLPRPGLADVTIEEYAFMRLAADEIAAQPGDAAPLTNLVATIARPLRSRRQRKSEAFDGYPRRRFNPELIPHRTQYFAQVPAVVALACLDYVQRCDQMLRQRYEAMFEGPASSGPDFGWKGLMLTLAESGIFGPESSVKQENIHNVCLHVLRKELQRREMEPQTNQNT